MEKQTITHLMFECSKVTPIWMFIQAKFRKLSILCKFSTVSILFNTMHEDAGHIVNLITLICKQYLFRCKFMPGHITK